MSSHSYVEKAVIVANIYNCLRGIVVVLKYPEKDRRRRQRRRGRRRAPVFALTVIWKSSTPPDLTTLLRQDTFLADHSYLSTYPSCPIPSNHSILEIVKSIRANRPRLEKNGKTFTTNMAGFLSSEALGALAGKEEDLYHLFNTTSQDIYTPFVDEDSRWFHAHTSPSGHDYFHVKSTHAHVDYDPHFGTSNSSPLSVLSSSRASMSMPSTRSHSCSYPSSRSRSRSTSPQTSDLHNYGILNADNRTWRCAYPSCSSKAIFVRPCDLRKHFHRHSKDFFCRHEGCPQRTEGGFSSRKDRARHEAKHNPGVECEWEGCERIFSRVDNMKDHIRRIHLKGRA